MTDEQPRGTSGSADDSADSRIDPIAVAFEAFGHDDRAPYVPDTPGGERRRPASTTPTVPCRGAVDPVAVAREALRAEEESVAEPEGEHPARGVQPRFRNRTKSEAPAAEPDEGWAHHQREDGTGLAGWLYHHADGTVSAEGGTVYEHTDSAPAIEPEPEPEPELEPEPEAEPDAEAIVEESPQIPAFVEYTPSEVRTYLLGAALVLASVAAVLTLFAVAPDPDLGGLLLAAFLGVVAALAGWALSSWNPTIVSIRDGVLEVARGPREEHFDLRDPAIRVEQGKQLGSPSLRTTVTSPDGHCAVIGARQVKTRHFTEIVEYHRTRLRQPEGPAGAPASGHSG